MSAVLIMAGGQSSRMRASLGNSHKALVEVLGISMLERNLIWLLALGFRELYLAIAYKEPELLEFATSHCQPLAFAFGAKLSLLVETQPLGNIGGCRLCIPKRDLIVIYVDNLTTLDLHGMLDTHRSNQSAMTIATHCHTFRMPFGQVVIEDQKIVDLFEKPEAKYHVSSGAYVLSKRACEAIPPQQRIGASDLFYRLKANGEKIGAYPHSSAWIDVNDSEGLRHAEYLIASRSKDFECVWQRADRERVVVLLAGSSQISVEFATPRPLLGVSLLPAASPHTVAQTRASGIRFITTFDEAQIDGLVTRFHVFSGTEPLPMTGEPRVHWLSTDKAAAIGIPGIKRCLTYAQFQKENRM
jgi:NDP-sugar pyrophosphorylase family protein